MQKRLVTISDISCLGKCSLTTALPILSALGHECCVLPTSLLSAHTAVFPEYTFSDLTSSMEEVIGHYEKRDISFDGILTGYLTGPAQSKLVERFIHKFNLPNAPVVVDPILGDHGKLYSGFTLEHVEAARSLCGKAHFILPNLTEAALLLNKPLPQNADDYSIEQIKQLATQLTELGTEKVIITGVPKNGRVGIVGYCKTTNTHFEYFNERQQGIFHGTGDIFAAAFFGGICHTLSWQTAAMKAADFTAECVKATAADPTARSYGTNFEQQLHHPVLQDLMNGENAQ